jgi:hypothetical protein
MKTVFCEKETYRQCYVLNMPFVYILFFLFVAIHIHLIILFSIYFFLTLIVRSGSIRNCGIAHSALTNLKTLRNCVLRTTIIKLWNCVLRTWKICCAAHLCIFQSQYFIYYIIGIYATDNIQYFGGPKFLTHNLPSPLLTFCQFHLLVVSLVALIPPVERLYIRKYWGGGHEREISNAGR